jgi:hypothetical protein
MINFSGSKGGGGKAFIPQRVFGHMVMGYWG